MTAIQAREECRKAWDELRKAQRERKPVDARELAQKKFAEAREQYLQLQRRKQQ